MSNNFYEEELNGGENKNAHRMHAGRVGVGAHVVDQGRGGCT